MHHFSFRSCVLCVMAATSIRYKHSRSKKLRRMSYYEHCRQVKSIGDLDRSLQDYIGRLKPLLLSDLEIRLQGHISTLFQCTYVNLESNFCCYHHTLNSQSAKYDHPPPQNERGVTQQAHDIDLILISN